MSLTVSDLPDGCYATVTYDNTTGGATVHIHVGPSAVNGTYTYNVQAIISNPNGAIPSGPIQAVQLYDVFADPSTPATEYPDFSLTFGGTSNPMSQISQQDAGFIFAPALTPPATYSGNVSNQNSWLTYEFLDWPTQEYFTVRLTPIAPLSPGFYRFALSSVQGGETVTLPMVYAVYGGNIQSNPINLQAQITIGPAWPPPQVLTTDGTVTLTTDDYAYSINQGDTIDIGIYAEGFTAFTGYWNFFLSEQSPESIIGTTPRFQNLWCVFPSNNKPESYSPTPGTPTLITTATLVTTLTTPPGVYAFTLADGVPTGHLLQTSLVNSGNPTSSGAFTLAISEITPPTPSVGGATFLLTITGLNGFNSPCTLGFIDLYDGTLISFYSNPAFPTLTAAIIPNSNLAPGTYTYTIQAAQGNVQFNGTEVTGDHNATIHITVTITATTSQFEGFNSATINVQVMDVGGEQAVVTTGTSPSPSASEGHYVSGTIKTP